MTRLLVVALNTLAAIAVPFGALLVIANQSDNPRVDALAFTFIVGGIGWVLLMAARKLTGNRRASTSRPR